MANCPPRHAPAADLEGHLTLALRYEGLDLAVLKRLFAATGLDRIEAIVRARPTGRYARRIWFLYEWLTGSRLDLHDADQGSYVPVVDPDHQWAGIPQTSTRHRVKNNLPVTPASCPLVQNEGARRVHSEEGGFVGELDRETRMPIPAHICARTEDLRGLIDGMAAFDARAATRLDPVIAAALLAFGCVYVHPFEDGNGRIHRYLIHHVLARRGFTSGGIVFPVSAAIFQAA